MEKTQDRMQNVGLLEKSALSENVEGNPKFNQSAFYMQSIPIQILVPKKRQTLFPGKHYTVGWNSSLMRENNENNQFNYFEGKKSPEKGNKLWDGDPRISWLKLMTIIYFDK